MAPLAVALALGLAAASAAAAPGAPRISGANTDVWNLAAPTPLYTATGSARGATLSWTLSRTDKKGTGASPLRISIPGLATGTYTLEVAQKPDGAKARRTVRVDVTPPTVAIRQPSAGAVYLPGQAVTADYSCGGAVTCAGTLPDGALVPTGVTGPGSFVVTATDSGRNAVSQTVSYSVGPAAPTITARPAQPLRGNRPAFSWSGGEPGAVFTWQLLSAGAIVSQGDTIAPAVSLGPLEPGAYAFQVQQTAGSGRSGPFSVADPFTVVQAAPPSVRPAPAVLTPSRLRPRAGATIARGRPLLSWRSVARARLYNLQVFRVRGTALTKVSSTFPRGTRARVAGLRFGLRYAWRVWPYVRGSGYTATPLGLSYFDMVRPVRVGPAQMLVNRRIAEAAVRRANAIEAWLDAGITAGDLRHEGLGGAAFDPALRPSGAPAAGGRAAAAVRPIGTGTGGAAIRARVRVSAAELLRTQRIAQSAVRHIAALETRLRAGLTGGDIVDGSIGAEKLATGVALASPAAAGRPAPRSVTVIPPHSARSSRVRLTQAQLLVAQRIAQGAVRRAEALRQRLLWGLSTADFRPGSIGSADLEPSLRD